MYPLSTRRIGTGSGFGFAFVFVFDDEDVAVAVIVAGDRGGDMNDDEAVSFRDCLNMFDVWFGFAGTKSALWVCLRSQFTLILGVREDNDDTFSCASG